MRLSLADGTTLDPLAVKILDNLETFMACAELLDAVSAAWLLTRVREKTVSHGHFRVLADAALAFLVEETKPQ